LGTSRRRRLPSAPAAAALSNRWNDGHAAWLGAGHAAACRRPLKDGLRNLANHALFGAGLYVSAAVLAGVAA
jgi:hypothetical protein